jgi:multiple sugar transport system substrate-binding protein
MIKKNVLNLTAAALFFTAILALTGCGNDSAGKTEKSLKEIVIISELFTKPSESEFVISQILNPLAEKLGITISFQSVSNDPLALNRIEIQKKSGNLCTNIEVVSSGSLSNWIKKGYVEDLKERTKDWKDLYFLPAFSKGIEVDGKIYFLPIAGNVYLFLANKEALKHLPEGTDINNLTWDQFADWAIKIKEETGFGRTVVSGEPLISFIYQFGTCALSYGADFPDINSKGAKKAWSIFERIAQADAFIPNIREISDCSLPMQRGEAWLTILNNAKVGEVFETNETRYVIGKMPAGTKGRGAIVGFSGMALVKGSENQDMSLEILKYLTRPDIQVKIARGTGGFVPAVEAALKCVDVNDPQDIVIRKAIHELKGNVIISGVPANEFKDWSAVKMIFDNVFEKIVLKKKKLTDEILDEAAQSINKLRKK